MRRILTYVGQFIPEWAFSKAGQNDMVGLSKLSAAVLGTAGSVNGLACTQTTVPSMQVAIGAGELYQMASLEASTAGTLPADTTNQILKQGILLGTAAPVLLPASSTFAAPGTTGQSINYLIEAQYQDSDLSVDPTTGTTPVVLPFYNSATPASPLSGPGNSGSPSNTFRDGIIAFQVKAGAAATTGSQVTPSVDTGWLPLYVVTVAFGQTTVLNANISVAPGAPIITPLTTGRLLNVQRFTSSGTYTPTLGTNSIIVEGCGGGGGGGGTPVTSNIAGYNSMGGAGGAGAYAKGRFTTGFSGATVTIGSGGTGASNAAGGNGGPTSLGAIFSVAGGVGGVIGTNNSSANAQGGSQGGGAITGGTLESSVGAAGGVGIASAGGNIGGAGGMSLFGAGPGGSACTTTTASPGQTANATNFGAGSTGGVAGQNQSAQAGGAGAPGVIIIYEYA